jgi:tyrosyl-tRNA synthetase
VGYLQAQVSRFLSFEGENAARLVNNLDWTAPLSAIDFLREIGKHYRVGTMLKKDAVSSRLNSDDGISYTEFSYQILQAMDYLELHRRHGCTLQVGGSDQWGNLVAGADLIRRVTGASVHALATPLITKPDGTKYGKTEEGAIWISPDLMSPYAFYQFWINRTDAEVGALLKVFTFRTREEIDELERATVENPAARQAQRILAQDVTTLVHGAAEYERAVAASRALFGQGDLRALDEATLTAALGEVPSTPVWVESEIPPVIELMARVGIVASRSAARRAIAEGGAYLNNKKVTDENESPAAEDLLHGKFLVLRRGKRTVGGVEIRAGAPAGSGSSV